MTRFQQKALVVGSVLAVAAGYLLWAGIRAGRSYYLPVDTFLADSKYHSQRVRLLGTVGQENVQFAAQGNRASFQLLGRTQRLRVVYEGVLPKVFKVGGEVVVEGKLDAQGVFRADRLMTKCASKYTSRAGRDGSSSWTSA